MEGLQGTAVPNGPGPLVRGMGSPAQVAVGAYGGCLQGALVCNGTCQPDGGR